MIRLGCVTLIGALTLAAPDRARADGGSARLTEASSTRTGTSAATDPAPRHRIERRRFERAGHIHVRAGFSYLSRGDLYVNPGVAADVTYHPTELLGLDLLSATVFASSFGSTARALRETTGWLPDSQRPRARLTAGARFAFAYGKILIESLDLILHVSGSASAHLGVLVTDRTANPGGDVGFSLDLLAFDRALVYVETFWFLSYEKRERSRLAGGPIATLGIGYSF